MGDETTYRCESMFLNPRFSFAVDEDFFEDAKTAKARLVSRIQTNHIVDQTVKAYKEFEVFLASAAIDEYLDMSFGEREFFETSNLANLRFVNLLNSILRSKDQIKKNLYNNWGGRYPGKFYGTLG